MNGGVLVYTSFFPTVSRVGWATTGGYDLTTGFGTPNATAYASALTGP